MGDQVTALACGGEQLGTWTEEQHAAFLDRMELSFVKQELGAVPASDERRASRRICRPRRAPPPLRQPPPSSCGTGQVLPLHLPLDRPLPDSAVESNRAPPSSRPAAHGVGGGK
ncbi:hypothetical protein GUJ93_ZPchr0002g25940 [Zizania palustris]|uniref:Uncharacterized protein n=1 Tax=Zizania palustris TaxID=103762 RepID=A0A8J5S1L3_ZIZPA|nr:hypothetical protein GUJ93_ZPchr0002g25940 [Zizania palustris]